MFNTFRKLLVTVFSVWKLMILILIQYKIFLRVFQNALKSTKKKICQAFKIQFTEKSINFITSISQ